VNCRHNNCDIENWLRNYNLTYKTEGTNPDDKCQRIVWVIVEIINQIIKDMNIVERNRLKGWVKESLENDEYTIAITVKLEQMDSYINYAERRMAELKAQVEVLKEVLTRR
tara:strand:+ start:99 stop:431 length:333 start_codon:yes stop_codon:yes gene_type:complete